MRNCTQRKSPPRQNDLGKEQNLDALGVLGNRGVCLFPQMFECIAGLAGRQSPPRRASLQPSNGLTQDVSRADPVLDPPKARA